MLELGDLLRQLPDDRHHLAEPHHQLDQLVSTQPVQRLTIHGVASLTEAPLAGHSADHV
jgi:hypothetical protein